MANSPNLTEVDTVTERNRSAKKMPSKSVKQAKTMSAIAHGWKPTGEAADIPVGVAKDFHAADKGKKYGKGGKKGAPPPSNSGPPQQASSQQTTPPPSGQAPPVGQGETQGAVDRSSHFKGNPGFPDSDKAPHGEHASQPQGHSIGVPSTPPPHHKGFGISSTPHTFRGMRGNPCPSSGTPGAHRIGRK